MLRSHAHSSAVSVCCVHMVSRPVRPIRENGHLLGVFVVSVRHGAHFWWLSASRTGYVLKFAFVSRFVLKKSVVSSSRPSALTTGPQRCTNEQLKTTASIDDALRAGASRKTSIACSSALAIGEASPAPRPSRQLLGHLTKCCAPAPVAAMIAQALGRWLSNLQPSPAPSLPTGPGEPNQRLRQLASKAFAHQNNVGWGHFLRGRLSLHWKLRVAERCKRRQPGGARNPSLRAAKAAGAAWGLLLVVWAARNGELHGKDYEEQRAIALKADAK